MRLVDLLEQRERYRGVYEPGSRSRFGQDITLTKPLRAYHATHQQVRLVLTNREVETYDSMGTWLSSSRDVVGKTFGPHVEAYLVPPSRYILAKRKQELRDLILNCLPLIREHVGEEAHDYLAEWGWSPEARRWLEDLKAAARASVEARGQRWHAGDGQIIDHIMAQYHPPWPVIERYKKLEGAHRYYRDVALSKNYNQAFRDMLERIGYRGIIWNNRIWDYHLARHTIFLVFHQEDLHPLPE